MKNMLFKMASASVLLLTGLANAGEVVVNSNSDTSGFGCTLREAVASINASNGLDGCALEISSPENRIVFNDYASSINLTGGELRITKPVEIDGGESGIEINANGNSRIFRIDNSAGGTKLKNLTLTGGSANEGGAIYTEGRLTVNNSRLTNNFAGRNGGGAIYASNQTGSLTIEDSYFNGNSTSSSNNETAAGAISLKGGILAVSNSIFDANKAMQSAIRVSAGEFVSVKNSIFSNNSSYENRINGGGAMFVESNLVLIQQNTFSNNSYRSTLILQSRNSTVSNNTFYRNHGHGVIQPYSYLSDEANPGFIAITNNTLWGNTGKPRLGISEASGGGVHLGLAMRARMDSNIFLSNLRTNGGDAINTCSGFGEFLPASSGNVVDEGASCGINFNDTNLHNKLVTNFRTVLENHLSNFIRVATLRDNDCVVKAGPTGLKECPKTIALIHDIDNSAIDNGSIYVGVRETTDQRGFPFDDAPDSGAYELDKPDIVRNGVIFSDSFETP